MVELDRLEKSYCVFTYCTKTLRPVPEQEDKRIRYLNVVTLPSAKTLSIVCIRTIGLYRNVY